MPGTRVSVPGKLILMGEHAVVYGAPAVVAAVGLRARVEFERTVGAEVRLRAPELGWDTALAWEEILELTRRRRRAWEAYRREPTPERYAALRRGPPWRLVMTALGEAAGGADRMTPGGALTIRSDLPPGAGLGSSAAVALGVVTALHAACAPVLRWPAVLAAVHEVERRQHGNPSGVDAATVFHGGVVRAERCDDEVRVEPLAAAPELLRCMRVLDTGAPAESTGEVVAAVRARRDADPARFDAGLERARATTRAFARALRTGDLTAALAAVREFERWLEGIGVVPPVARRLTREVEDSGGAAKVSGAGALSGDGAGAMLVLHPEPERLEELVDNDDLRLLPAALGVEGVRVERAGV